MTRTNPMIPLIFKEDFPRLMAEEPLLVLYFSSEDCSVCLAVQPKLEALLAQVPVKILKVEASQYVEIAGQHLVFAMPTVLIFQKGKEILRESRFIDFQRIQRLMDLLF